MSVVIPPLIKASIKTSRWSRRPVVSARWKMTVVAAICFLALLALQTGCSSLPVYHVDVIAKASPATAGKRTYVIYVDSRMSTSMKPMEDLYAKYLTRVLRAHGLKRVSKPEDADMAVVLYYSVDDAKTQHYHGGTVIPHTHTEWHTSPTMPYVDSEGHVHDIPVAHPESYSYTTYTQKTWETSYTTFYHFVYIVAYDLQYFLRTGKDVELWSTAVGARIHSGQVWGTFPILMAAAAPYVFTNAGEDISVNIREDSPRVKAIESKILPASDSQPDDFKGKQP